MGASVESSWRESDAVEEKTAGIELYANAAAGFDGVLKERFSDFIVREIDKDTGKAVRLDDLSAAVDVPIDARERAKFDEMKARVLAMEKEAGLSEDKGDESEEGEGDDQIDEDAMTEFEALCGAEDAQRLREFLATPGVTRASQKKLHSRAVLPDPLVLAPMPLHMLRAALSHGTMGSTSAESTKSSVVEKPNGVRTFSRKSRHSTLTERSIAFKTTGDALSARARRHASRILALPRAAPVLHRPMSSASAARSSRTVARLSRKSTQPRTRPMSIRTEPM